MRLRLALGLRLLFRLLGVEHHGATVDDFVFAIEHQARIFDRYEQLQRGAGRQGGSFGLGLWIVRQVVEALEGTVGVESTPGDTLVTSIDAKVQSVVERQLAERLIAG